MSKIVVFSLDYDGCSDILFEEELTKLKDKLEKDYPAYFKAFLMLRAKFKNFLDEKAQGADEVEVYVGSNRQSHDLDRFNSYKHKNGSCFTNYLKLCKDKGWRFRPLLLADAENNLSAGEALKHPEFECSFDADKIKTLTNQLIDTVKNHPNDEVIFYFFDDDMKNTILSGLKTHFATGQQIPKNILFVPYKFDWIGELKGELVEALEKTAHIQGKKEIAIQEKKSSPVKSVSMISMSSILIKSKASLFTLTPIFFAESDAVATSYGNVPAVEPVDDDGPVVESRSLWGLD